MFGIPIIKYFNCTIVEENKATTLTIWLTTTWALHFTHFQLKGCCLTFLLRIPTLQTQPWMWWTPNWTWEETCCRPALISMLTTVKPPSIHTAFSCKQFKVLILVFSPNLMNRLFSDTTWIPWTPELSSRPPSSRPRWRTQTRSTPPSASARGRGCSARTSTRLLWTTRWESQMTTVERGTIASCRGMK